MVINMSQSNTIEICDIYVLLEKAETMLDTLEDELFDDTEPQVDNYKYYHNRHRLNAYILGDYIREAKKTLKALEE